MNIAGGVSIVHDDGMKIGKFSLDFQANSFEYTGIKLTSGAGFTQYNRDIQAGLDRTHERLLR